MLYCQMLLLVNFFVVDVVIPNPRSVDEINLLKKKGFGYIADVNENLSLQKFLELPSCSLGILLNFT